MDDDWLPDYDGRSEVSGEFSTFQELELLITKYELANFVQVWKREARTINAAKKRIDR